ncbi:MAG: sulfatase-like hydrolase/transferase, partial [Planctomycetales bacterium]|nr:sulfatase-like hydrolase/transferase [Planctomycetales bacterium]
VCCPTTDWLYAWMEGDRIPKPPTKVIDRGPLPKHPYSHDNRPGMIASDFDVETVDLVLLKRSQRFLKEHVQSKPDQPFFLYHATQAVHLPSFAAKQFQGKSGAGPHGDFIVELDFVVGELLKTLDELGVADKTLVLLTSDNGPETTSVIHMRLDHQHDGARPWRGMKRDNWEGGHRVPLIARWPGKIAAGKTSAQTICLTDVMATVGAATGSQLPNDAAEDSINFLPVLLGTQPVDQPIREFTLHQTISLALAIRRGPWKYLDHQGSGGNNYDNPTMKRWAIPNAAPDAPGQLYNLADDPGETNNLYLKHPEIVRELKSQLDACKAAGRSAPQR